MAQFQAQQPTHVILQPIMQNANPFHSMHNEWQAPLCSCCDDFSQCCYAYFCWPCFACDLADRINESKCSCFCLPNALAAYRMKVRATLHIRGDSYSDHCTTIWCGFCAGLQMDKELKYHGIR